MLTNFDMNADDENHLMRFLIDCHHLEGREAAKPPPESAARYILSYFLKDTGFPAVGHSSYLSPISMLQSTSDVFFLSASNSKKSILP